MLFVCKNDVQSVANRELNYASDLLILEGDRIDEMELANFSTKCVSESLYLKISHSLAKICQITGKWLLLHETWHKWCNNYKHVLYIQTRQSSSSSSSPSFTYEVHTNHRESKNTNNIFHTNFKQRNISFPNNTHSITFTNARIKSA